MIDDIYNKLKCYLNAADTYTLAADMYWLRKDNGLDDALKSKLYSLIKLKYDNMIDPIVRCPGAGKCGMRCIGQLPQSQIPCQYDTTNKTTEV